MRTISVRPTSTTYQVGAAQSYQYDLPVLADGLYYIPAIPVDGNVCLQAELLGDIITLSVLSGEELCQFPACPEEHLVDIYANVVEQLARRAPGAYEVVLPNGALLSVAVLHEPSAVLADFLAA